MPSEPKIPPPPTAEKNATVFRGLPCLIAALLASMGLAILAGPLAAGELEDVREEVREPQAPEPPRERRHHHDDCDDDEDFVGSFLGELLCAILFSRRDSCGPEPVIVRYQFAEFPYACEYPGYLVPTRVDEIPQAPLAGRLAFSYGLDFHELQTGSARLMIDTTSRFGFELGYTGYFEDLAPGSDSAHLADAQLLWRLGQSPFSVWRIGAGLNSFSDSLGTELGINFTLQMDLFPRPPWVISARFDAGTLGSAGMYRGNASLGYMLGRCELFTGYDYRQIGSAELDTLEFGLRIWF